MYTSKEKLEQAKKIFRTQGGILRTSEAIRRGIHPRTLYFMRDHNYLDVLARGTYRLSELEPVDYRDIVTVASKRINNSNRKKLVTSKSPAHADY